MEVHNHDRSEVVHKSDGVTPHGSIANVEPNHRPAPFPRPYPYIFPIYTPVYTVPVVAEVPIAPPIMLSQETVQAPINNASTAKQQISATKIFGLEPLTAGIITFSILAAATLAYAKRDSIKSFFK